MKNTKYENDEQGKYMGLGDKNGERGEREKKGKREKKPPP